MAININIPVNMKKFMLRMRERRAAMKGKKEFKQAALVYISLKIIIVALIYLFVSCKGCDGQTNLIGHILHITLFSHFIYAGMRVTTSVMTFICFLRGTAYIVNFFFAKTLFMKLPLSGTTITVLQEKGLGNWIFLIKGIFMYIIVVMVLRAIKVRFFSRANNHNRFPSSHSNELVGD